MKKLSPDQIRSALTRLPDWKLAGDTILRTFVFKDFVAALRFVNRAGKLAEAAWHHPDIDIRWNKVTLTLSTHDAGGLTRKDMALARKLDGL